MSGSAVARPRKAGRMSKPLFTVNVVVPEQPKAVYYVKSGKGAKPESVVDQVTHRVRRLAIVLAEDAKNGDDAHYLRRLDSKWKVVWQTRHPSLQETFWHAEWEYDVQEGDWEKSR